MTYQIAMQGKQTFRKLANTLHHRALRALAPNALFYVISHERSGAHLAIHTLLKNTFVGQRWHSIGEWFGPYELDNRFEHIDEFNRNWYSAVRRANVILSHCDRPLFEARYRKAKVVYVVRDPRDTLASFYDFLRQYSVHRYHQQMCPDVEDFRKLPFSEFLRRPIGDFLRYNFSLSGKFDNVVERWAAHVKGWMHAENCLIIRYEDLLGNAEGETERLARFLGLRLRGWIRPVGLIRGAGEASRRGVIGFWRNRFSDDDEQFLRRTVERYGSESATMLPKEEERPPRMKKRIRSPNGAVTRNGSARAVQ